jgi:cytochrome c-type biogenesis protein CcmH/NrfG
VTALALALIAVAASASSRPAASPRLSRRLALAALAALIALVQVPGLVSTSRVRDSQEAFRDRTIAQASAYATEAIDTQPWAASPYVQAALVKESTGSFDGAARLLRAAIRREPTNWRHPLILARIEAELGHVSAALKAFKRARQLRPESRFYPSR